MKISETLLRELIGNKDYSILQKAFASPFVEIDENLLITHIGPMYNVAMQTFENGKFVLSSPVRYRLIDPLYGEEYSEGKASITIPENNSKNSITISTPDYHASIGDETLSLDGLKLTQKDGEIILEYQSPIIPNLDENYRANFYFRTKNGLLEVATLKIQTLRQPFVKPKKDLILDSYYIDFQEKSADLKPASEEKTLKLLQVLSQLEACYYERVQTGEAYVFQVLLKLIRTMMNNKRFGFTNWNNYQRDFERALPELYQNIKNWLTQIQESLEDTFYMQHHEISRLIKAKTSMIEKLSGEKK